MFSIVSFRTLLVLHHKVHGSVHLTTLTLLPPAPPPTFHLPTPGTRPERYTVLNPTLSFPKDHLSRPSCSRPPHTSTRTPSTFRPQSSVRHRGNRARFYHRSNQKVGTGGWYTDRIRGVWSMDLSRNLLYLGLYK